MDAGQKIRYENYKIVSKIVTCVKHSVFSIGIHRKTAFVGLPCIWMELYD